MSGPDPILLGFIFALASAIVAGGWFICLALIVLFLQRTVKRVEAAAAQAPGPAPDSALLLYALSVFFWPAAFLLGAYLMKQARTARQGRTCIYSGLANITLVVVATCVGMTILGFVAPGMVLN